MVVGGGEEKILVSVRVRPLNEKEKSRYDRCDWECINETTIICKSNNLQDKPSYTFDKVFGFECPTKQVYEDGAKEIALCVLSGINSSIFAYGQTSSGKTYTMTGITQYAINDIFHYIEKHEQERKFTLKFSAMEIYNEAVRDLLCEYNTTPLRLLDDPERGTVVEKLREETLTDRNHLEELLSICETQRKIGETSLNETSSRSHQILRLTIESSKREASPENAAILAASVCFIDLAGSERASQTLSAGSRLKEGCHINRSLLTLGTVIRKLSKGRREHIPYRDSKLTRILQNSLGGNARTAIICTMSPARSHMEQSRNTLLFATCAKEVTTNAQVNMVVSEKALVKQLQRELARMENELKNLAPISSASSTSEFYVLLKEKEELIEKMEEQIQELKWQRDVAQSQVENLLKANTEEQSSTYSVDSNRRKSYDSADLDVPHLLNNLGKSNLYSPDEDGFLLDDNTPQFSEHGLCDKWEEMAQNIIQEPEDSCKEVRCIEVTSKEPERVQNLEDIVEKKFESLSSEYKSFMANEKAENEAMESKEEDDDSSVDMELSLYSKHEANDEVTIDKEVQETEQSMEKQRKMSKKEEDIKQNLSRDEAMESEKEASPKMIAPALAKSEYEDELIINKLVGEVKETEQSMESPKKEEAMESEKEDDDSHLYTKTEPEEELSTNLVSQKTEKEDDNTIEDLKKKVKEMQKTIEYFMSIQSIEENQSPSFSTIDENTTSPGDCLKMRKSRSCKDTLLFTKGNASTSGSIRFKNSNNSSFDSEFSVSSDPQSTKDSDTETSGGSFHEFLAGLKEMAKQHQSTHKETETEKMKLENIDDGSIAATPKEDLKDSRSQIIELWGICNVPLVHRTYFYLLFKGDPSDFVYMEVELRRLSFLKDSPEASKKQTAKVLTREREWLAKQIPKKFGRKEKEELYKKWGVELSSKQRSLQVTHKLWNNAKDNEHCKESASLVATLVGFVNSNLTQKEMFGLSFSPTAFNFKSSGWRFSNSFSSLTG